MSICAIILAAGEGKRMNNEQIPKVMIKVLGRPMLDWVINTSQSEGIDDICVVVGYKKEIIENYLGDKYPHVKTVLQTERRGTGHAVKAASDFLTGHQDENVLILCGDAPLMDGETIRRSMEFHVNGKNDVTVISADVSDPAGYGRVVRSGKGGEISSIVEHKDATDEERKITEINSGAYWFKVSSLISVLDEITNQNAAGEYYLTDAVSILLEKGKKACCYKSGNSNVVLGANTTEQLIEIEEICRNTSEVQ